MYAVIATGGKQYRVTKDAVLRVEKLDAEPGATVEFGEVLLVGEGADVKVGKPTLKGGKVLATVVRPGTNVGVGTDHTLFARVTGKVQFQKKGAEQRLYVSVLPEKA